MEDQFDPLGIHALHKDILFLRESVEKLIEQITHGAELPISESLLIEKTGITRPTLYRLRRSGQLRWYKPGKEVMYIPSEFTADIKKLNPF